MVSNCNEPKPLTELEFPCGYRGGSGSFPLILDGVVGTKKCHLNRLCIGYISVSRVQTVVKEIPPPRMNWAR